METLLCNVMFNGDLRVECTGEVVGKATPKQVERSYSASNSAVGVGHSRAWWGKHAPKAAALMGWTKSPAHEPSAFCADPVCGGCVHCLTPAEVEARLSAEAVLGKVRHG